MTDRASTRVSSSVRLLVATGLLLLLGAALGIGAAARSTPNATGTLQTDPHTAAPDPHTAGYRVWAHNDDGTPVRWDPCSPVVLVTDPDGAPPDARTDLDSALAVLRTASGLDLIVAGNVSERPSASRAPYQPDRYGQDWAPVLVAWAAPGEGGLPLRSFDRGVALPIAAGPAGDRTFVSGQVVLNAARDDLRPGFDDRADAWGNILLHELMHLLGLDHVDDPDELMYPFPGRGPVQLGSGDRAGLAALGAGLGCREVPQPQDVEVVLRPPS